MFDPITLTVAAAAGVATALGVPQAVEARKARIATRRATEKTEVEARGVRAAEGKRKTQAIQRRRKRRGAVSADRKPRTSILTGSETGTAPATASKTLLGL